MQYLSEFVSIVLLLDGRADAWPSERASDSESRLMPHFLCMPVRPKDEHTLQQKPNKVNQR